jgi:hypothetical protein
MDSQREGCEGQHRYFALEMIVEDDNTVTIPLVCTACGDLKTHVLQVKAKKTQKGN